MAGMADGMVEWQTEMATYVLFTVHTDDIDGDNDTLIFYSIDKVNKIREKKYFGMPLFLFRVIVSLIKERDLATRILVQKLNVVNHLIPTQ